jgi:hypothetical protein
MTNQTPDNGYQYGQTGQPTAPQHGGYYAPQQPPKKPGKGKKILAWVGGAFVVLVVLAAIAPDDKESAPVAVTAAAPAAAPVPRAVAPTTGWLAPTTTPRAVAPAPVAPAPAKVPAGYKQNKLLTIGEDIQPGKYTFVVPESAFLGFVYTCSVGSDCNSAMTATNTDMFSAGEEGEYTVPTSGYIKLDDVLLTPAS